MWVLPLDVTNFFNLSLYASSTKANEPNLRKLQKKKSFGTDFGPFGPNSGYNFFFKNLTLSVTRYHGHIPSITKSEKANYPILRKRNAERMERQTVRRKERQTDRQD